MDRSGLTQGTAGNLSARTSADEVVMTPTALDYAQMTTEDLVVCNLEGRVLSNGREPTTEASLHLACLRRHRDIAAVVHSHALHASQFAVSHQPIPCLVEEFELYVGGDVPIAPYRTTGSEALGEVVAPLLADRSAALLANHGLVSVGATPGEALAIAKLVERTAQIVAGARLLGEPVPLPNGARTDLAARYQADRAERATRLYRS